MAKPKNLEVTLQQCKGDQNRLIKRFIKKFKKSGIMDELRDRRFHQKKSDKRRRKKNQRKRILKKEQQKRGVK
jgi:ribosomal protein S21|tara:strand:+ start:290 stop:508 length:219 start_codon:yes stop_codon:yes gene_type:complete